MKPFSDYSELAGAADDEASLSISRRSWLIGGGAVATVLARRGQQRFAGAGGGASLRTEGG